MYTYDFRVAETVWMVILMKNKGFLFEIGFEKGHSSFEKDHIGFEIGHRKLNDGS